MTFSLAFYLTDLWLIIVGILATLMIAGEIGWRIGRHRPAQDASLRTLVGGIAGATLALMGLLLGFTLSMAISRYDARRAVIVTIPNPPG